MDQRIAKNAQRLDEVCMYQNLKLKDARAQPRKQLETPCPTG